MYNPRSYRRFLQASVTAVLVATAVGPIATVSANDLFKDVSKDHWAYDSINKLANENVIQGFLDETFRPGETLTRGQAAELLTRALDLSIQEVSTAPFKDISQHSRFAPYALAMKEAKIFLGNHNGEFLLDQELSRQEMASILVRAFQLEKYTSKNIAFSDFNQISDSHKKDVEIIASLGITVGIGNNNYGPTVKINRAQMAVFLDRTLTHIKALQEGQVIDEIKGNNITISGIRYDIAPSVNKILNEGNSSILKDANIHFTKQNNKITSINYLKINQSGTATASMVLDGGEQSVSGSIDINGDYVSLKNIKVTGNITLGPAVENSFTTEKVIVDWKVSVVDRASGLVSINSAKKTKLEFTNSKLQQLQISKNGVNVSAKGTTTFNSVTISGDAEISGENLVIPKLTLLSGNLELNAKVDLLIIDAANEVTLFGQSAIKNLEIKNEGKVNLETKGTIEQVKVENEKASLIVGNETKLDNISLPKNLKIEDLVKNYESVKRNITKVDGETVIQPAPPTSSIQPSQPPTQGDDQTPSPDPNPSPDPDPSLDPDPTIVSLTLATDEVEIFKGDIYTLPEKVTATMSAGPTQEVDVNWWNATIAVGQDRQVTISEAGTYNFLGTVDGYDGAPLVFTLSVEEPIVPTITSLEWLTKMENVALGTNVEIPATITAIQSNDQAIEVPVVWGENMINTNQVGVYTVLGTVADFGNQEVFYQVNVSQAGFTKIGDTASVENQEAFFYALTDSTINKISVRTNLEIAEQLTITKNIEVPEDVTDITLNLGGSIVENLLINGDEITLKNGIVKNLTIGSKVTKVVLDSISDVEGGVHTFDGGGGESIVLKGLTDLKGSIRITTSTDIQIRSEDADAKISGQVRVQTGAKTIIAAPVAQLQVDQENDSIEVAAEVDNLRVRANSTIKETDGAIVKAQEKRAGVDVTVKNKEGIEQQRVFTLLLDTQALEDAINVATILLDRAQEGDKHGQYELGAKNTLQEFLTEIKTFEISIQELEKTEATQDIIDEKAEDLLASIAIFEMNKVVVDFTSLIEKIVTAKSKVKTANVGFANGQVPLSAVLTLEGVIAEVEKVVNTGSVQDVTSAIGALDTAIALFEAKHINITFTALDTLISEAEVLHQNAVVGQATGQYTQSAKERFKTAINEATAVKDNPHATQVVVNRAVIQLQEAVNRFKSRAVVVDFTKLSDEITKANDMKGTAVVGDATGQFPADAKVKFEAAIAAADTVLKITSASQLQVDTALKSLLQATQVFEAKKIVVDLTQLETMITQAKEIDENSVSGDATGQYPEEAKLALTEAIAVAEIIFADPLSSQAKVEEATEMLEQAIQTFEASKIFVDIDDLEKTIQKANELIEAAVPGASTGQYDQHVIEEFNTAIEAATAVLNNLLSNQQQVDNALVALNNAIEIFKATAVLVDFDQLSELIEAAQVLNNGTVAGEAHGNVPQAAKHAFENAITAARAILEDEMSTQVEVDAAITALNSAMTDLQNAKVVVILTELQALITQAEEKFKAAEVNGATGHYPEVAKTQFGNAISAAKAVVANQLTTNAQVQTAISTLNNVIANFEGQEIEVQLGVLETAITSSRQILSDAVIGEANGEFPQVAYDTFERMIEAAEEVFANPLSTQAQVDKAQFDLLAAKDVFILKKVIIGKDGLENLIDSSQRMLSNDVVVGDKHGNYPESARANLLVAIDTAIAILEDTGSTQAIIDEAIDNLRFAVETFNKTKIVVDFDNLLSSIERGKNVLVNVDAALAPETLLSNLNTAITEAELLINKASQQQVDTAVNTLINAIRDLEETVYQVNYDLVRLEAELLLNHTETGVFPATSLTNFRESLAIADNLAEEATTKEDIDLAIEHLHSAMKTFVEEVISSLPARNLLNSSHLNVIDSANRVYMALTTDRRQSIDQTAVIHLQAAVDFAELVRLVRIEMEKFHRPSNQQDIELQQLQVGQNLNQLFVNPISGTTRNPDILMKVSVDNGRNGHGGLPLEYISVDAAGNITVSKLNNTSNDIQGQVHITFEKDGYRAGFYVHFTLKANNGAGQEDPNLQQSLTNVITYEGVIAFDTPTLPTFNADSAKLFYTIDNVTFEPLKYYGHTWFGNLKQGAFLFKDNEVPTGAKIAIQYLDEDPIVVDYTPERVIEHLGSVTHLNAEAKDDHILLRWHPVFLASGYEIYMVEGKEPPTASSDWVRKWPEGTPGIVRNQFAITDLSLDGNYVFKVVPYRFTPSGEKIYGNDQIFLYGQTTSDHLMILTNTNLSVPFSELVFSFNKPIEVGSVENMLSSLLILNEQGTLITKNNIINITLEGFTTPNPRLKITLDKEYTVDTTKPYLLALGFSDLSYNANGEIRYYKDISNFNEPLSVPFVLNLLKEMLLEGETHSSMILVQYLANNGHVHSYNPNYSSAYFIELKKQAEGLDLAIIQYLIDDVNINGTPNHPVPPNLETLITKINQQESLTLHELVSFGSPIYNYYVHIYNEELSKYVQKNGPFNDVHEISSLLFEVHSKLDGGIDLSDGLLEQIYNDPEILTYDMLRNDLFIVNARQSNITGYIALAIKEKGYKSIFSWYDIRNLVEFFNRDAAFEKLVMSPNNFTLEDTFDLVLYSGYFEEKLLEQYRIEFINVSQNEGEILFGDIQRIIYENTMPLVLAELNKNVNHIHWFKFDYLIRPHVPVEAIDQLLFEDYKKAISQEKAALNRNLTIEEVISIVNRVIDLNYPPNQTVPEEMIIELAKLNVETIGELVDGDNVLERAKSLVSPEYEITIFETSNPSVIDKNGNVSGEFGIVMESLVSFSILKDGIELRTLPISLMVNAKEEYSEVVTYSLDYGDGNNVKVTFSQGIEDPNFSNLFGAEASIGGLYNQELTISVFDGQSSVGQEYKMDLTIGQTRLTVTLIWENEAWALYSNSNILVDVSEFQPLTRAKVSKLIVEALGIDTDNVSVPAITDVSASNPYYKYIATALNNGLMYPFASELFLPDQNVKRSELAAILYRAWDIQTNFERLTDFPFEDVMEGSWYGELVVQLYYLGVISGQTEKLFAPNEYISVADTKVFIHKISSLTFEEEPSVEIVNSRLEVQLGTPVNVKSTSNGTVYLIPENIQITSRVDLENVVLTGLGGKVEVGDFDTVWSISTLGLISGGYRVYHLNTEQNSIVEGNSIVTMYAAALPLTGYTLAKSRDYAEYIQLGMSFNDVFSILEVTPYMYREVNGGVQVDYALSEVFGVSKTNSQTISFFFNSDRTLQYFNYSGFHIANRDELHIDFKDILLGFYGSSLDTKTFTYAELDFIETIWESETFKIKLQVYQYNDELSHFAIMYEEKTQ